MRYTERTIKRDTERAEWLAGQLLANGVPLEGLACIEIATQLRQQDDTPAVHCPPYMVAHCIARGYDPEWFAAEWAGEHAPDWPHEKKD